MPAGDSFMIGMANVGNSSTCKKAPGTCSPGNYNCNYPVGTENAAISWGPLTANNFSADYQVIAWSGAGLVTSLGLTTFPDLPIELAEQIIPSDVELFGRQVAGDSTSLIDDHSAWAPQAGFLITAFWVDIMCMSSSKLFT